MECPRCSCTDFVRVGKTHAFASFFFWLISRLTGYLVICANCGVEMRVNRHGIKQTLRSAPAPVPTEANGASERRPIEPRLRDPDQPWARRR